MNGYNFTERVRRVLATAREEAVELKHEYVGTEHMLLALLREGEGVANAVLQNLHVDCDKLRDLILDTVKKGQAGPSPRQDLPYTSRSKRVLELAMTEARTLGHSYVGTEHLLLGLIAEGKGVAAQVLDDAGVKLETARGEVIRVVGVEPKREFSKPRSRTPDRHVPGSPLRVRQIISAANEIAVERKAPRLEPAHVVMALMQHQGGMANAALDRLGFDRTAALSALGDISPARLEALQPGRLEPTPSLVEAIQAMEAADETGAAASHDLLLALLNTCVEIDAIFAAQSINAAAINEQVRFLSG